MDNKSVTRSPQRRMAVILFIDIADSSELSNVLSFEKYDELVWSFQTVAKGVLQRHVQENTDYTADTHRKYETSMRGDEMCTILYSHVGAEDEQKYRQKNIRTALQLAIEMKRKWLCGEWNCARINDGKSIIDIGIGINCGYVIVDKHWRVDQKGEISPQESAEGYAINLAKRIEGYSRSGVYSKIFVSRSVYNILRIDFQIAFSQVHMALFKGIAQAVPVYEIKSFGHVEDTSFRPELSAEEVHPYKKAVDYNPHELWLILDLAHHYYDRENYEAAAQNYRLALEVDPKFSPAHMYLGRSYYRDFVDEQAFPHLERARELNPDSARANNFLGVCLRRMAYRAKQSGTPIQVPESEWKDYYRRAIEFHKIAIRIAEQDPERYIWAFNAYAMTLAQAVHESALWDRAPTQEEKDKVLEEAERYIKAVFRTQPQAQKNLFHHVKGFIMAVYGRLREADEEFRKAIQCLRESEVPSKKYREKMAELYFHRGLLGCRRRTDQYKRAVCEAFVGDLLWQDKDKTCYYKEKCYRQNFVAKQYWFTKVKGELEAESISIEKMFSTCHECITKDRKCSKRTRRCPTRVKTTN